MTSQLRFSWHEISMWLTPLIVAACCISPGGSMFVVHKTWVASVTAHNLSMCIDECGKTVCGYPATPVNKAQQDEIALLINQSSPRSHFVLGGSRQVDVNNFRWVTGPYGKLDNGRGAIFFNGSTRSNGYCVPTMFCAFPSPEPNSFSMSEMDVVITRDGGWNDIRLAVFPAVGCVCQQSCSSTASDERTVTLSEKSRSPTASRERTLTLSEKSRGPTASRERTLTLSEKSRGSTASRERTLTLSEKSRSSTASRERTLTLSEKSRSSTASHERTVPLSEQSRRSKILTSPLTSFSGSALLSLSDGVSIMSDRNSGLQATLTPYCSAPPFRVNASLRIVEESVCRDHYVCPTSRYDSDGGVTLSVAYDAMTSAHSLLLLLAEDGVSREWLSVLPSVRFGMVVLDTVAESGAPNLTLFGVVVLRPGSGWPGLEVRRYAVQRLPLVVSLRCVSANGTVVSHPSEMVLRVTPRSMPVAALVQAVVQSSQAIAGGLGSGGGTEALTMGRLATSLSLLSTCDDALQGYGAGLGVLSVSGDLLAAVDTIVGNVVFVTGATVAAAMIACGLYLCASSRCPFAACYRDVMRLPLALFPIFAATLPSTVMSVVAVLRDVPVLTGGAASGAYCSIAAAATIWGGALVVVSSTTRRMALLGTLRSTCGVAPAFALIFMLNSAFQSSTEWASPQPADISLFEGTTVLWFLPLDVCLTVAMAAVSALPLSGSHALCVGANAVNVGGCAAMLAVAALRRPFSTPFARIHSVVTYVLVLALAVIGLFLAAASSRETYPHLLLAVNYLSGGAAVLSALKAVVDVISTVTGTRKRYQASKRADAQPVMLGDESFDTVVDIDALRAAHVVFDGVCDVRHVLALPEVDLVDDGDDDGRLQPVAMARCSGVSDSPEVSFCDDHSLLRREAEIDRLSHPFGELLDAYQILRL